MKKLLSKLFSYSPIMYLRYVNVAIAMKRKVLMALGYIDLYDFIDIAGGKISKDVWIEFLATKNGRIVYYNDNGNMCSRPKFDRAKAIKVFRTHLPCLRIY